MKPYQFVTMAFLLGTTCGILLCWFCTPHYEFRTDNIGGTAHVWKFDTRTGKPYLFTGGEWKEWPLQKGE